MAPAKTDGGWKHINNQTHRHSLALRVGLAQVKRPNVELVSSVDSSKRHVGTTDRLVVLGLSVVGFMKQRWGIGLFPPLSQTGTRFLSIS
jgi:hypothetical protein